MAYGRTQLESGHRALIKRAIRAAGAHVESDEPTKRLNSWARNNPREIANTLARAYKQAGRHYERSNDGSNLARAKREDLAYKRVTDQADSVVRMLGLAVNYPGIYPNFQLGERDYRLCEIRRALDDSLATHRVTCDGQELYRSTEPECFGWIHRHTSYSVYHATKHEGYAITAI